MSQIESTTRHTALSLLVVALVMSAGCSSFIADDSGSTESGPSTATTAETGTPANDSTRAMPSNGTDLRSLTVPDGNETNVTTAEGEIDSGDPILESTGTHYEPVQFAAQANTTINVSVSSDGGAAEIRVQDPNGSSIAINSDTGADDTARINLLELNQTGQYTLIVAATNESEGLEYTATVERFIRPLYFGDDPAQWSEETRYNEFAYDYITTADNVTENLTALNYSVDAEEDYVVLSYVMSENATLLERVNIDAVLQVTYTELYREYTADNPDAITNETWVPDRVYHRAVNWNNSFYRSSYINTEWAIDYGENNDTDLYGSRYYATLRWGPAHPSYEEGGNFSTTASEFPEETYANFSVEFNESGFTEDG